MAEIPVERKSGGVPWWVWLLGALALLGLLALLARGCDDRGAVVNTNSNANSNINANRNVNAVTTTTNTNVNATTNANANTGVSQQNGNSSIDVANTGSATGANVTDVNIFGNTQDQASLVGRRAELTNVKVNRVLSDKVFTVTSGKGEMFVMLDDNLDTAGGKEQQIKARPGQVVNLGGSFRNVPTGETASERQGGDLNSKEYAQMKGQRVYLHATSVKNAG